MSVYFIPNCNYTSAKRYIINEWLADAPQVRRVVRKVSNTFWFFREILRYGKDCKIVSPESVRDRFREELKSICQQYDIETND